MDISTVDITQLTHQLRKPEGDMGVEVGKTMAQYNAPANAFVFTLLNLQPADHVLEIGFGPGEGIAEAVRLTPRGYVAGIDHSETMLAMAEWRNHRAIMEEHVELALGDAKALPYEYASFDAVYSVNVFHFWPEPLVELAECKRVLKPGGRIVFFVVHPSVWPAGFKESGVFIAREPAEAVTLFGDAGFREVESKDFMHEEWKGFVVMGKK